MGARAIGIDHLIHALLSKSEVQLREVLEQMDVAPDRLLKEYADARLGQITTKFRNDVATDVDRLGYDNYARAIAEFLTHAETPPPLSISIQAPWGGGKSSLMNLVREKLDPRSVREKYKPKIGDPQQQLRLRLGKVLKMLDRAEPFTIQSGEPSSLWTVWFNAWKYETSEQIWAGLVDAIVSQVAERLPLIEREKFLLKLQLSRIDDGIVRKKIYDRVITIWWSKTRACLLFAIALVSSLVGLKAAAPVLLPGSDEIAVWLHTGTLAVPMFLAVYLVATYVKNRSEVRKEPATFSLAEFIRVPNYDKTVGEIHQIHADLRRVLDIVPRHAGAQEHSPLVIFIDDLDRCSPGKVASVVEGVSMLLASDTYRCMFVIGMDPQMVAAALEKAHEDVRKQLPRYERAVPLGWRFMDKFIQLPFTIPPASGAHFDKYLDWLTDMAPVAPASQAEPAIDPTEIADPPDVQFESESEIGNVTFEPAPPADDPGPTSFSESRDVGAIIRAITKGSIGNPREMKRMVNLARFYLALRAARRNADETWRAPSPQQYARWIAITLRWPDMMRWLQWGADEASWGADSLASSLVERRLARLEEIAAASQTLASWKAGLSADLMIPTETESGWACDPKLLEFFSAEGRFPKSHRLSAAAARGFW